MEDFARTGLLIKRLQNKHHNAANAALGQLGLTIVQWDALRRINATPEASLHDLAVATFQSDQAFGTLAGRLESRGLVERVPGPGRAIRLTLTDAGREALRAGAALFDQVLAASFAPLDAAQLAQLNELLGVLLADEDA